MSSVITGKVTLQAPAEEENKLRHGNLERRAQVGVECLRYLNMLVKALLLSCELSVCFVVSERCGSSKLFISEIRKMCGSNTLRLPHGSAHAIEKDVIIIVIQSPAEVIINLFMR